MGGWLDRSNVLLLQGPMGPFFYRFAKYLKNQNKSVHKINFNAGDALFYPDSEAIAYRGERSAWPDFLKQVLQENRIGSIYLFGDCRPYHRDAIELARALGVTVFVFEEGYIRPDYVTMERHGVNGFSTIPREPGFYRAKTSSAPLEAPQPGGTRFSSVALSACAYYGAASLLRWRYPHYSHHRPLSVHREMGIWTRAAWRKLKYRVQERSIPGELAGPLAKRYFLVPLQVFNDSQVRVHSRYEAIEDFIEEVVASFAANADRSLSLVFKHHPMDRGHRDYSDLIQRLAQAHDLADRVKYVHDLHLPTLLRNAAGVVLINSTVGLSALFHSTPVKVMGEAVYDMRGLTFQQSLDRFWRRPGTVDRKLFRQFRAYLIEASQLNGSFYGRFPFPTEQLEVESVPQEQEAAA